MSDLQDKLDRLERLFADANTNTSEIIRCYKKLTEDPSLTKLDDIIPVLNQKAVKLLTPELVDILTKYRLAAYSYLLVANSLLNSEDVKDDLLKGDVLKKAAPASAFRKLKDELCCLETGLQALNIHFRDDAKGEDSTRLALRLTKQCTNLKQVEGNLLSCVLNLKETSNFISGINQQRSTIERFSLGEPDPLATRTRKTVLLVGATGSGKTTLINAMANYVLGVEWDDHFRFVLVDEVVRNGSSALSQTQGVTAYDLHYREGFRIPFSLTIIDTPGFGDTGGMERDKEISSAIKNLFKDKNGIEELDAVGFVVKCSDVRLTPTQTYIYESVLSIFGKDIEENIRFLATFSDTSSPLVLAAIKEAKLPCRKDSKGSPCHQKFNNGAIYKLQQTDVISHLQWKNGTENFKLFFEELSDMPTKSLQMTREVLELKQLIERQRNVIRMGINGQLMKMEELRKTEEIIASNREKVDANKNFEIKAPVIKKVKVPVSDQQKALNCTVCNHTCHFPCNPSSWKESCPAFPKHMWHERLATAMNILEKLPNSAFENLKNTVPSELVQVFALLAQLLGAASDHLMGNVKCNECPGKCPKEKHQHEDFKWEAKIEEETRTLDDVRDKYKDAQEQQLNAEGILMRLKEEVEQVKGAILEALKEITRYSNVLKKIALRGDRLTIPDHIQMIIDSEKKEEKPGYEERIKSLHDLKTFTEKNDTPAEHSR